MTHSPSKSARDEAEPFFEAQRLVNDWCSSIGMSPSVILRNLIASAIEKAEKRGVIRGLRMALHSFAGMDLGRVHSLIMQTADRLELELRNESVRGDE